MTFNKNNIDTGLRGRGNGELYVDKKVFFARIDVRKVIRGVIDSPTLKKQLNENRNSG